MIIIITVIVVVVTVSTDSPKAHFLLNKQAKHADTSHYENNPLLTVDVYPPRMHIQPYRLVLVHMYIFSCFFSCRWWEIFTKDRVNNMRQQHVN